MAKEPLHALPSLPEQADRLVSLGVHDHVGLTDGELRAAAAASTDDGLLVINPRTAPASKVTRFVERRGKPAFVVVDMPDVDDFRPIDGCAPPDDAIYVLRGLDRGDELANRSPHQALPLIRCAGRSPLTITEGLFWLIQEPEALARNNCFMTIGSRLVKKNGDLDARTPALWISNGTGRDGADNRNAPKVGWCWAGNRHSWLGFASAQERSAVTGSVR